MTGSDGLHGTVLVWRSGSAAAACHGRSDRHAAAAKATRSVEGHVAGGGGGRLAKCVPRRVSCLTALACDEAACFVWFHPLSRFLASCFAVLLCLLLSCCFGTAIVVHARRRSAVRGHWSNWVLYGGHSAGLCSICATNNKQTAVTRATSDRPLRAARARVNMNYLRFILTTWLILAAHRCARPCVSSKWYTRVPLVWQWNLVALSASAHILSSHGTCPFLRLGFVGSR